MNKLNSLLSIIGVEKTLCISGHRDPIDSLRKFSDDLIHFPLESGMMQRHDAREKERLRKALEQHACTQIVVLGWLDEETRQRLATHTFLHSLRKSFRHDTPLLLPTRGVISGDQLDRAMLEQHVIAQCYDLTEYHFVRGRIENKQLHVRGITGLPGSNQLKTIFCNGIPYDHFLAAN